MNHKNYVIAHRIFEGTVDQAPVYPREITKLALNYDASSIMLGHNHPAGSLSPSLADEKTTQYIKDALETVGVKVLDHIIVANNEQYSFRERNWRC